MTATNHHLSVILEIMEDGGLNKFKNRRIRHGISEDFVLWTLYQVALGIQKMHSQNILHRNISSDIVLARANGEVKLSGHQFVAMLS